MLWLPQCGKLCPTHTPARKRRHLNFFQDECLLEARVPRSNCPEHGVLSVAVPWAREGSGFSLLFEALRGGCAGRCRWRRWPMLLGSTTPGSGVWRPSKGSGPRQELVGEGARISVDETSARRGHRYVRNVLDAKTHELLLMVEGRGAKALEALLKPWWPTAQRLNKSNSSAWI